MHPKFTSKQLTTTDVEALFNLIYQRGPCCLLPARHYMAETLVQRQSWIPSRSLVKCEVFALAHIHAGEYCQAII